MKRLFQIASGLFVFSIIPIATQFLVSIILNKPYLNGAYSLTYPLQFVFLMFKAIFATGANIKATKEKNPNSVYSSGLLGLIAGGLVFGIVAIFIDDYVTFMHMDVSLYRNFALFYVLSLFVQLIFAFVMEKMFFEGKEKLANIHSIIFNLLMFASMTITSLITKNEIIIVAVTLGLIFAYAIAMVVWQVKKFKFEFNILSNFKYESMTIVTTFLMFIIYFFGFQNAFQGGEKVMLAISFVSLVTDAQWDGQEAIATVAKIDLANDTYNHKRNVKHSYILFAVSALTSLAMFFGLYWVYGVDLTFALIYLSVQFADQAIGALNKNVLAVLQLKYSPVKNTIIAVCMNLVRALLAIFLPTVFCTHIGQISSSALWIIISLSIFLTVFRIHKDGTLERKKS